MERYRELIENYKFGYEVLTERNIELKKGILMEGKTSMIIELNP